jgi:branched-chain amino acid transport system substrate-binding protein
MGGAFFKSWPALAAICAALAIGAPAQAGDTVKIGAIAAVTHWPNIELWVHEVNARGGLKLKDGQKKIELIEYDDRTIPGEAIKAVERLATQDKADFVIAPYGTGFNLACAPIFHKYGYPQIAVTTITDKVTELTQRYDNLFFSNGDVTTYAHHAADVLVDLLKQGKIGNRLAMVNVADTFGIEIANAARPVFEKAGFKLVYDKSYPLGTQDLAPVIKGAKAANPDAFVGWSYPPDSFGLTDQAKIEGLNVKVFYLAVGASFPGYIKKYGAAIDNVMAAGGVNHSLPAIQEYYKRHKEVTGVDADFWGSPQVYSTLQVLEQAIEGVGSVDRKAVVQYIKDHTFNTVMGPINYVKQNNEAYWTVGQWHHGVFDGVKAKGRPGAKPVTLKNGW